MILPSKVLPFLKKRLAVISLLWAGVFTIYFLAPTFLQGMAEGGKAVSFHPVALASFADGHLVAALFLGIVFVAGILSLLLMNVYMTGNDQDRALRILYAVWDEVSSASTHVGCAYLASLAISATQGHNPNILDAGTVAIYLAIGFLAFHFEASAISVGNAKLAAAPAAPAAPAVTGSAGTPQPLAVSSPAVSKVPAQP